MPTSTLTIGQLAASAGVTRKAIRVWVQKGLLAACDHTPSGYQLFAPETVELAVFIRRARVLGLSLPQIQDIIQTSHESETAPCTDVRRLLQARITDIDTTIADLLALRSTLQTVCAQPDTATEAAAVCPIIERSAPPEHPADKSLQPEDDQVAYAASAVVSGSLDSSTALGRTTVRRR